MQVETNKRKEDRLSTAFEMKIKKMRRYEQEDADKSDSEVEEEEGEIQEEHLRRRRVRVVDDDVFAERKPTADELQFLRNYVVHLTAQTLAPEENGFVVNMPSRLNPE